MCKIYSMGYFIQCGIDFKTDHRSVYIRCRLGYFAYLQAATCKERMGIANPKSPIMTSSNGNIFLVTGPLCREFTGHRWIPLTKPVTRSFDVFFDLRHRAHYDVTVMLSDKRLPRQLVCERLMQLMQHFLADASFGLRVLSLPASDRVCVCASIPSLPVSAKTRQLLKLEPPNSEKTHQTLWLRSLSILGWIDLGLQGQI